MANLPEGNNLNRKGIIPNVISSSLNSTLTSEPPKDQKMASSGKLPQEPADLDLGNNASFDLSKMKADLPPASSQLPKDRRIASIEQLIQDLLDPNLREHAMLELSKKREILQDLAPLLWNSGCTIAALFQEIISIYPLLSPPNLTAEASNRVCNALALLQCVASHPDTRTQFLTAQVPLYLYPFLNTTNKTRPFEYLRLTSLGVIGALVKVDDTEVISFLLSTEIIPLCLRTMEVGRDLSKTITIEHILQSQHLEKLNLVVLVALFLVATFIVQKILLNDVGLEYVCVTPERFYAVAGVLGRMVQSVAERPSQRLLKHAIRCYLRLSDDPKACESLKTGLPEMFRDPNFRNCLGDDAITKSCLQQLLYNIAGPT